MSESEGLSGFVSENFRVLLLLVGGYVGYVEFGAGEYPTVPEGSPLLVTAAVVVGVGGYVAAGKINDLLPEEEGIYLVAFDASSEAGGSIWELSEDKFEDMEVFAGTLFQWPVSKRVYECREYRPDDNVAVANWRESVAGSELAGDVQVVDALEAIGELREEFEPEAQKFRTLSRRLRQVARKMDRRRDRDQQKMLDPHLTPEFGDEKATVSDIIHEDMPEHLLPESMQASDQTEPGESEGGEFVGFDVLDDMDGLDPVDSPEVLNDD